MASSTGATPHPWGTALASVTQVTLLLFDRVAMYSLSASTFAMASALQSKKTSGFCLLLVKL